MLTTVVCMQVMPSNPKTIHVFRRLTPSPPIEHLLALSIILHESVLPTQTLKLLLRILLGAVLDVRVGNGSLAKRSHISTSSSTDRVARGQYLVSGGFVGDVLCGAVDVVHGVGLSGDVVFGRAGNAVICDFVCHDVDVVWICDWIGG